MLVGIIRAIGRFLHQSGCDIHITSSFGCNAVLWSAQGAGTSESIAWLFQSGSDFTLINSNGHSALHKAAQRGSSGAVKWLVNTFLLEKEIDAAFFIAPDMEGNCPSDLCGMEGHESLAEWISNKECDYFTRLIISATSVDDFLDNHCIPSWLQEDLHEAKTKTGTASHVNDMNARWGTGCGVRRMALGLLGYITRSTSNEVAIEPINDFNDID